jgi:arginyl-tRNA synthetase
MNLYDTVRKKVIEVVINLSKQHSWKGINFDAIVVEIPNDTSHGEMATNAALVLSKSARKNPSDIAALILGEITKDPMIYNADIAGPGFINFVLEKKYWYKEVASILNKGHEYGKSNIGKGKKVNIEFVSANPTGPLHIGHARGAVFGDALAILMEHSGYDVTREYYINDAGVQINVLVHSCYLRYRELCGEDIGEFPEGFYPGDYIIDAAKNLKTKHGDNLLKEEEGKRRDIIREFMLKAMMDLVQEDLMLLGIKHDVFFSEETLHAQKKIDEVTEELTKRGLVYKGVLDPPKGKLPDDWEEREQLLFKGTTHADDIDRPLQKSDGNWTYFAADIAYLKEKLGRKYDDLILILGADHVGYQGRMFAAHKALSDGKSTLNIKLCQLVSFLKDGKPLKMSKRSGNFETVRQVVDSIGKDIVRFIMLTIKNDSMIEFDLEKVKETSKENPVFYVQYANARTYSVLGNADNIIPGILDKINVDGVRLELLKRDVELDLIRILSYWPKQVALAAQHQEPHRITIYLINLATKFHSMWSKGKGNKSLKFVLPEDVELTKARLTLLKAVSTIIEGGLNLMGVTPVKKM